VLVVATLVRAEAHGLVADAEDSHVVMLQEAMTPSGKCADASEKKTWQDCLNGEAIGFVKGLDNGIESLDDCKAAIMVNCFSIARLTASYSASNDECAWYDSCDMNSLADTEKDWRTGPAELKSDAMAVMVNAQDQLVAAKLSMMVCGTTCVCEGIDSCQGTCNYKCSPSQIIRPNIRAKGAGAAAILTTLDIQNPLKVCFSMGRGGGEWVWQNVQLVKNLNRFEIASAPGQNVISSSLRDATSCRTLPEPCFTTSGPCAAPSTPAGTEPGLQAEYWQLDTSCALPSNQVFSQQIPNFARLETTPQTLADLPFVQLAPAADGVSFAGSWKGAIKITAAGTYTFYALSTGNVAVWVSGKKVVSNIGCPSAVEKSGTIDLNADSFPSLLVRFSHKGASAGLTLSYDGPDESSKVEIPAAVLWHHVPPQAAIKNVVLTVVGRGDVPHIEVCGTKSVMGSCKYNAGCDKTCATPTKLTHGESYLPNSATTVSISRGRNSDFLQKVTEVCFFFPSVTVSQQFVWESVTVEGQLAQDGSPFKIVPLADGAPISFVAVGRGHKQCQSGTFDDTSAFPYQVANNEVPN
jgi:hypothetical protein